MKSQKLPTVCSLWAHKVDTFLRSLNKPYINAILDLAKRRPAGLRAFIVTLILLVVAGVGLAELIGWGTGAVQGTSALTSYVAKSMPASTGTVVTVDEHRFTVVIASLAKDRDEEYQDLIRRSLEHYPELHTISIPKTIELNSSPIVSVATRAAQDQARKLLQDSKADVLIWGSALPLSPGKLRLSLTSASNANVDSGGVYTATEDVELPELFWHDLQDAAVLHIARKYAQFKQQPDSTSGFMLGTHIDKVRTLLGSNLLNEKNKGAIRLDLAEALLLYGQRWRDKTAVEEAYRLLDWLVTSATSNDRDERSLRLQLEFGQSSYEMFRYNGDASFLRRAESAFNQVLLTAESGNVSFDLVEIQTSLCHTYRNLGESTRDRQILRQAMRACGRALDSLAHPGNTSLARASVYLAISNLRTTLGMNSEWGNFMQLDQALRDLRTAELDAEKAGAKTLLAGIYNNLGLTLYERFRWGAHERCLQPAIWAYTQAEQLYSPEMNSARYVALIYQKGRAQLDLGARMRNRSLMLEGLSAVKNAERVCKLRAVQCPTYIDEMVAQANVDLASPPFYRPTGPGYIYLDYPQELVCLWAEAVWTGSSALTPEKSDLDDIPVL